MERERVVKELTHYERTRFPVTSAYLTVSNDTRNRKAHLIELKKMFRYKQNTTYFNQLPDEEQESVRQDFAKIYQWYDEELDTSNYISSICFSSAKSDYWKVINMKIPLDNELAIEPTPAIYQLSKLFSNHRRYGVVLVDKSKAKIFEYRFGEYLELFKVTDNAPESIKVGGFKGRRERNVERNIRHRVIHHYKEVAQKAFELYKNHRFHWIVLGGHKEAISDFQHYLHDYLKHQVMGIIEVEPEAPLSEVFGKIRQTEGQARQRFERELIESIGNNRQGNRVIYGIEAIVPKVRDSWVDTLIINYNYQHKGAFCRKCDYLTLKASQECPHNCGPLERTDNIVDRLLYHALNQSVNIQFVDDPLAKYGHIAAILRFPLSG